jgi:hypothetical protein
VNIHVSNVKLAYSAKDITIIDFIVIGTST